MKFLTDFGPLLIFFTIYFKSGNDLEAALFPFIIATLVSLIVVYFLEKKIPLTPLLSGILVTFFGGLTLYFNNPIFYYIKPTVINLLFAVTLLFGKYVLKKIFLKLFFQENLKLTDEGWNKLNDRWIIFFVFAAILNEVVWRTQSEVFWVNFKLWGLLTITFLFTVSQLPLINKHKLNK